MRIQKIILIAISSVFFTQDRLLAQQKKTRPNIVIIYADDMGYGDLGIQNPNSKIPTPSLDQLAREGMRFTDAHSSSGICSPSRFALQTGMYHWRRQHSIVGPFGKPFFNESDYTLAQMLKSVDYFTAAIGKWHLGWDWEFKNEPSLELDLFNRKYLSYQPKDIDWSKPIKGGPLSRGFDYYFGDGTINFPPYAWIENDRFITTPTTVMLEPENPPKEGSWEFRPGPAEADWDPYKVLPTLEKKVVEWVHQQSAEKPFYLYFALPSPHAPIIPNDEFDGKSQAGAYGDFMVQTDKVVGSLLEALKEKGLDQNTLVIFSADNGPENYAFERTRKYDHYSMGNFRGLKRDVWEGGHHVPFLVRWPGVVKEGSICNETISQVDIMATIAQILAIKLPENAAPDSYNILPLLVQDKHKRPIREATVHNTNKGNYGLRQGKWMYLEGKSGSHNPMPEWYKEAENFKDFDHGDLLFDLSKDEGQRIDLSSKYPKKVQKMKALLKKYQDQGYSLIR